MMTVTVNVHVECTSANESTGACSSLGQFDGVQPSQTTEQKSSEAFCLSKAVKGLTHQGALCLELITFDSTPPVLLWMPKVGFFLYIIDQNVPFQCLC